MVETGNIIDPLAVVADDCIVSRSVIKPYGRLKKNVEFRESILGEYSYVSSGSIVNKTEIGKFTSIGPGTYIGLWEHNTDVSTHSFYLYETSGDFVKGYENYKMDAVTTYIGCDVWIGANVSIRKGVTVGHGAIIGSSAVVTKDVPPYSIMVGNPARILRKRFSQEDIEMFLNTAWWDFERNKLKEMIGQNLFHDFDAFKHYIKKLKNEF